jgi:o-succinylbenzoate synthase
MKICEHRFYFYKLPLIHSSEPRRGILLLLKNEKGQCGWGDIAPLPGWSTETLQEAYSQLKTINFEQIDVTNLYPSVAFGIESALASLQHPLTDFSPLPIIALLMGNLSEILQKSESILKQGYTTTKLKISQLPFEEALALVRELKDKIRLRIDLNRAWNLEQSVKFFSHFSPSDFDYVEEPVSRLADLKHFEFPFALDESFREGLADAFLDLHHCKAIVFKPTLHGGFSTCAKIKNFGKEIVLSPSFESGIGIYHIASFIERLSLPKRPVGLDTYSFLLQDLLETPLDFFGGHFSLPSEVKPNPSFLYEPTLSYS